MQKHVLVLTTSAFFLACGTIAASAQQGPMTQQQPQMLQQRREQERQVSHWHALNDAAYLRHLVAMPDVELIAIQDSDAGLVAKRAAEVGSPPTFTDYRKMLATTRP